MLNLNDKLLRRAEDAQIGQQIIELDRVNAERAEEGTVDDGMP